MTPRSCGTIIAGVVLVSSNFKSNRLYSAHVANIKSMRAKCRPIQLRGPVLKGRKASFISSVGRSQRSGTKDSGLGKMCSWRCVV